MTKKQTNKYLIEIDEELKDNKKSLFNNFTLEQIILAPIFS